MTPACCDSNYAPQNERQQSKERHLWVFLILPDCGVQNLDRLRREETSILLVFAYVFEAPTDLSQSEANQGRSFCEAASQFDNVTHRDCGQKAQ